MKSIFKNNQIIIVFLILIGYNKNKDNNMDISSQEFYELSKNKDYIVVDVRTKEEFDSGHIINALNIDFYQEDFDKKIEKLEKNKIYLIYCRSGKRSKSVLQLLYSDGFRHIYNLKKGIIEWKNLNLPIEI